MGIAFRSIGRENARENECLQWVESGMSVKGGKQTLRHLVFWLFRGPVRAPDPSAFRLPAVNGPFVVVLDFVSNRTTEGVRAWPESKPLLDQAAGQRIELRNAART